MKKFPEFLQSIIFPRKMVVHRKMNFFLALFLFILSAFVNISTSNLITRKKTSESFLRVDTSQVSTNEKLPAFTSKVENTTIVYKEQSITGDYLLPVEGSTDSGYVKNMSILLEDKSKTIDFTFVFDYGALSSIGTTASPSKLTEGLFDLEGYFHQYRKVDTTYVLFLFTKDQLFYLYDLGEVYKDDSFQSILDPYGCIYKTGTSELEYYLPKTESELVLNSFGDFDTTKWTRSCLKDDVIDFTIQNPDFQQLVLQRGIVKASTRHQENLSTALYARSFNYGQLTDLGVELDLSKEQSLKTFLDSTTEAMIDNQAASAKLAYALMSLIISIIFPFLWVFVTWLVSKRFELKTYREYYAIASICYLEVSLISVIWGIFQVYEKFALFILAFQAIYYLFVTFRINTENVTGINSPQNPNNPQKPSTEDVKFRNLKKSEDDFAQIG